MLDGELARQREEPRGGEVGQEVVTCRSVRVLARACTCAAARPGSDVAARRQSGLTSGGPR